MVGPYHRSDKIEDPKDHPNYEKNGGMKNDTEMDNEKERNRQQAHTD